MNARSAPPERSAGTDGAADVHVVIQSSIKWDFLWQGHQIRALLLAERVPVTFVETTGFRRPGPRKALERVARASLRPPGRPRGRAQDVPPPGDVDLVAPLVLPPTDAVSRALNRRLFVPALARRITRRVRLPIVYLTYLPTRTALALRDALAPRATVYHCLLDFPAFPGAARDIAATEAELVRLADRVIVDSRALEARHREHRSDVTRLLPGVDVEHFRPVADRPSRGRRERPVVAYFGGMASHRIDWNVVRRLGERGVEVRLFGPVPGDPPALPPGISFRGSLPYAELPDALAEADAFVLPYLVNDFTRSTFPVKLFQCFAMGRPVVSTPLPEVLPFQPLVEVAATPDAFAEAVQRAARESDPHREQRLELASRHSWHARTDELLAILRDAAGSAPDGVRGAAVPRDDRGGPAPTGSE